MTVLGVSSHFLYYTEVWVSVATVPERRLWETIFEALKAQALREEVQERARGTRGIPARSARPL